MVIVISADMETSRTIITRARAARRMYNMSEVRGVETSLRAEIVAAIIWPSGGAITGC
jgi:hypothetical protein